MKHIYLLFILLFATILGTSQNINYTVEIVEFYQTGCDDGIGSDEEPTWKIWARDNTSASWVGGDCNHTDGNIPITYVPSNVGLYNKTNSTATLLELRFHGWEDDCGDRCDFDPSCTLGTIEDDCEEFHGTLAGNFGTNPGIIIKNQPMCQWNEYSYTIGPYGVKIRINWEYNNFTAGSTINLCGSDIQLSGKGSGEWSITSGTGGSFSDNFDPSANFSGTEGVSYILDWNTLPGCLTSDSDNITVNFNEVPVPNLTASTSQFCEGQSSIFTAEDGFNYDFALNTSINSIQNSGGTSYTHPSFSLSESIIYVTVSTAQGCSSLDSILLDVLPTPAPTISLNNGELSTESFSFYQWYLNGSPISGGSSQTFTPSVNGNYTVEGYGANGCVGVSSDFILSNVSITEEESISFTVYPNPSNGNISVRTNQKKFKVRIRGILGKTFVVGEKNQSDFNLRNLSPGIYFVQIETPSNQYSKKIVLK